MVRMKDNYLGGVIKVRLIKHSTKTISPTGAKYSNDMENKALVSRLGVLVRARFHLMLVDYNDESEMKLRIDRYLVNCDIVSFG